MNKRIVFGVMIAGMQTSPTALKAEEPLSVDCEILGNTGGKSPKFHVDASLAGVYMKWEEGGAGWLTENKKDEARGIEEYAAIYASMIVWGHRSWDKSGGPLTASESSIDRRTGVYKVIQGPNHLIMEVVATGTCRKSTASKKF